MQRFLTRVLVVLAALSAAAPASAQPQGLERVGPTSTVHGFPTWYQDKTGVTLEFCQPQNQAELDGGWCLLLAGDTTVPELFPTRFADEHFYWAGNAAINTANLNALLVLGLEAAFATGPVIDGDQLVFARIRIRFDAPATGTYTIYHPYGVEVIEAVAGERVFFTEDIGIQCKGTFDCALAGRIGPFLLPSNTPGGPELAAIVGPVPGKLYIASPDRLGPVTGSPVGQNFFRIIGPGVAAETYDFSLMGRLYQGTMPGRMTVDRARYSRDAGSVQGKLDVFATAFATTQPRLPGTPIVGAVTPLLGFYPAACSVTAGGGLGAPAGVSPVQMFGVGSRYYGQAVGDIPASVCVQDYTARDPNGQAVPAFSQATVTDQVTITQASFNPAEGGVLTVTAWSSDQKLLPGLTSSLGGQLTTNPDGSASLVASGILVPPLKVLVTSALGGRADLEVSTLEGTLGGGNLPLAGNDAFTVAEDSGTHALSVLVNDTIGGVQVTDPAAVSIAIVTPPSLGTAIVDPLTGTIAYTPRPNANGRDLLAYTITSGALVSPPAFVNITITGVNDPPIAVDDTATGVAGLGISIALLANDIDVDGAADLVGAVITSAPAGVTYSLVGGVLSFSALAGTHTFRYQAKDAAGTLSNEATVTVTLTGGETLSVVRAEYIANKRRWRVEGTSSVLGAQTVYVMYANGTFADGSPAVGYLVASTQVDATGLWAVDFTLAGTNDPRNPTNTTLFSVRPSAIYAITTLGGSSPVTPFIVR